MTEIPTAFEEVQLVYTNKTKAADRPKLSSPQEVYEVLRKNWDMNQIDLLEECKVLLLDNSLRLMSIASVSKGGLSGTVVDPRIVFSIALRRRANSIILAHNHPCGELKPSQVDMNLTRKFIEAGKVLQLPLNDHLIINSDSFCSMLEGGFMDQYP